MPLGDLYECSVIFVAIEEITLPIIAHVEVQITVRVNISTGTSSALGTIVFDVVAERPEVDDW
jgi:hypothetical protein